MSPQWFISRDGGQTEEGPLPVAEVLVRVSDGRLAAHHLARPEGGSWEIVSRVLDAVRQPPKSGPPPLPVVAAPPPPPLPPREPPARPSDPRWRRKGGEYDREQFNRCWDGLAAADLDSRELLVFACTLRKPASIMQGVFGGPAAPIDHLAIFPTTIAVLVAPPGADVRARSHRLGSLTWTFAAPANVRGFADSNRDDLNDAAVLTVTSPAGTDTLYLRSGSTADEVRELLPELALARANEMQRRGRGVQAERYLDKVPEGTRARPAAEHLRAEIGTIAAATVDHRQGLPGVATGARGTLRFDPRGLEFFEETNRRSLRVPLAQVRRLMEVRKGLYPAEYTARVEAQRKKVKAAAWTFFDPVIFLGAQAAVAGARQELAEARYGQPLSNRLVLVLAIQGKAMPVVFDLAGTERVAVERAASEFHIHLETFLTGRDPTPREPAVAGGFAWEPPEVRDRLTALHQAGHLTGEDYGFLMTILSKGGSATAPRPISPSPKSEGVKLPEIKIDVKLPSPPKAGKPSGPLAPKPPATKPPGPPASPAQPTESIGFQDPGQFAAPPFIGNEPVDFAQTEAVAFHDAAELAGVAPTDDAPTDIGETADGAMEMSDNNGLDLGSDIDLGSNEIELDVGFDAAVDDMAELDATFDAGLDAGFEDANFAAGFDTPAQE